MLRRHGGAQRGLPQTPPQGALRRPTAPLRSGVACSVIPLKSRQSVVPPGPPSPHSIPQPPRLLAPARRPRRSHGLSQPLGPAAPSLEARPAPPPSHPPGLPSSTGDRRPPLPPAHCASLSGCLGRPNCAQRGLQRGGTAVEIGAHCLMPSRPASPPPPRRRVEPLPKAGWTRAPRGSHRRRHGPPPVPLAHPPCAAHRPSPSRRPPAVPPPPLLAQPAYCHGGLRRR